LQLIDMLDGDPKKLLEFAKRKQQGKPKTFVDKMVALSRDAVKLSFALTGQVDKILKLLKK
jgi:hypothetical protein